MPKKEHDDETLGDILEEEMTATSLVSDMNCHWLNNDQLHCRLLMKLLPGLRCVA